VLSRSGSVDKSTFANALQLTAMIMVVNITRFMVSLL
jgi:hypothetical protein